MVSHIMLFISIQLTSKYVSQRIKMEKAETVNATFSFGSKIAQVPMRSYCHEVLADGGGIFGFARLLRGRCSSMLRLCSPAGFQMGSAGIRCLGEMAGFCKRAFSPAALVVKNGLFLYVWRNFLENVVALFGCAKQQLTSSKGDWISRLKGLRGWQHLFLPLRSHLSLLQ